MTRIYSNHLCRPNLISLVKSMDINGYHDILGEIPPGPIKPDKISMKTASATGNRGGDHRGFTRAAAKKRFSWVLTFCPSWLGRLRWASEAAGWVGFQQLKPTHHDPSKSWNPKSDGKHLCPSLPNPHLFVPPLCRSDPWLCAATNSWCAALLTSPAANISIPYQRHNRESISRGHEGIEYARFQRTSLSQSQSRGCCVPPFLEPLISVDHWKGAPKVPLKGAP